MRNRPGPGALELRITQAHCSRKGGRRLIMGRQETLGLWRRWLRMTGSMISPQLGQRQPLNDMVPVSSSTS